MFGKHLCVIQAIRICSDTIITIV